MTFELLTCRPFATVDSIGIAEMQSVVGSSKHLAYRLENYLQGTCVSKNSCTTAMTQPRLFSCFDDFIGFGSYKMGHEITQSGITEQCDSGLSEANPHREFLEDRMDPDFGLLDKLLKSGALSRRDLSRVKAKDTFQERNAELLDHIAKQHKYNELIVALRDTKQGHLVRYLEENGIYSPGCDGNWPLTEAELRIFDTNQESLVDLIETSDFISKLLANNIINIRQQDFIAAKQTQYEKNEALLDILRRRSLRDYRKTIECLHQTNQSHIAEIFEKEGVVVAVHANLSGSVPDVAEAEEEIASKIAALLQMRTKEESERILGDILEMVDAKLIGGKVGHSVVLYFLCQRNSGLLHLRGMWASGRLAQITEALFNRLLSGRDRFKVTVSWSDSDYEKSKAFFQADEKSRDTETTVRIETTLGELPLELLDMILKNACLLHMGTERYPSVVRDKDIFSSLASVDFCWFQRLKRRRFKTTLLRHIADCNRRVLKKLTIIRNNRDYLSETIQPKDLVIRLRRSDCLTDRQIRSIRRHQATKAMNDDLLGFVRKLDTQRYSSVIECLPQKSQKSVARILEQGGASVRASFLSEKMVNLQLAEQETATTFSELRDKRIPMPRPLEKLLKRIRSIEIEILNISYDRGITIWVLCKSSNGLQKLHEAMETTKFQEDIAELFREISLSDERIRIAVRPSAVVMDISQFTKEVAVCSASVKLITKFQVNADYVYGMTKLNNNVYILCQSPNSVAVFRDQSPFDLLKTIEIPDIRKPEDIGASQRDVCLYISDSGNKCIWKKTGDQLVVWMSSVDWPFTMSVARDGQVLIARKGQPSIMELYGHDSVLVQRISMPNDIIDPLHGIQTTTGNLVISHWWRDSVTEGVCELTRKGQVACRFIGKGKEQELTFPRYLALDSDDRVFVTDFDNNRVILLDSDLSFIRVLLTRDEDGIEYPERLCYDKTKKQLMVGHVDGVNVYTLEFC